MTEYQLQQIEQRQAARCQVHYLGAVRGCPDCERVSDEISPSVDAVDLESPLQEQIESECRKRGWVCVRTRMDCKNSFTMKGVCDIIVAADGGQVLWIECKTKTGKQTPEQVGFQMLLNRNGHVLHVVRSMRQFRELAKLSPC